MKDKRDEKDEIFAFAPRVIKAILTFLFLLILFYFSFKMY